MSIYKKLMQARLALQSKVIKETGHNKFAGYYYLTLGDFMPTVQQIFADLGLCGIVSFTADLAKLTIHSLDDADNGVAIVITSPMGSASLKGCHEVQNIGAVETYQRRYLWVTAMEIVEHDALDSTMGSDKKESTKSEAKSEWDKLPADTQNWFRNEAMAVITMLNDGDVEGAFHHIESLKLDDSQKTAIWSLFDSKQRSAIKAFATTFHAKKA